MDAVNDRGSSSNTSLARRVGGDGMPKGKQGDKKTEIGQARNSTEQGSTPVVGERGERGQDLSRECLSPGRPQTTPQSAIPGLQEPNRMGSECVLSWVSLELCPSPNRVIFFFFW